MLILLVKINFILSLVAVILVTITGIADEVINLVSESDEDELTKEYVLECFSSDFSSAEYTIMSRLLDFIASLIIWFEKHYIVYILLKYLLAITPIVNIVCVIIFSISLYQSIKAFFFSENAE